VAEAGFSRIGATFSRDLADGEAHATGNVYDGLQIRLGQQVSAADVIALKGYAASFKAVVIELYDQASLRAMRALDVLIGRYATRMSSRDYQQEYQSGEPDEPL
jgi:hypothetical protein